MHTGRSIHPVQGAIIQTERDSSSRKACVALSLIMTFGASGLPSFAHAETVSRYDAPNNYSAQIYGMPDLDQKRLASTWHDNRNSGRMYCGPTSAANVLNYFVHEGFEGVDSPSTDFEPIPEDSLTVLEELLEAYKVRVGDSFIATLADEMDTGAFNWSTYNSMTSIQRARMSLPTAQEDYSAGTSYLNLITGLEDRLPGDFAVQSKGGKECTDDSTYTITPRRIFNELHAGHIVILNIGRYISNYPFPYSTRNSGHYVVVTGISRDQDTGGNDVYQLWYNDPAASEDNDWTTQSGFHSERTTLQRTRVETSLTCERTRWEMLNKANYFLDGMIVVEPGAL